MDLSRSLLKDFAKITNDFSERSSNNAYVRGSVKTIGNKKYVKVDGSEGLTPISEVVDVDDGDRVLVAIENHVATILGNFTFPPSARKEEEALNKAEDANNNANNAHNKAEDANNKADEAIKDATNASSKAEEAKKDAQAAINASNEVKQNVEDAKQMAQDANSKSDIAIEESGKAQHAVAGANEEINRINGEVTTVKGDISNAITELEKQANDIQATKEEMKLNYTSKTETSEVEASLKTEIIKKVGELQSTVEQTYAGKNEVVEIEGKLQSQITQNAEGIKSTVSKTEKLEADTKEAQNRVDQALSSAFDAQAAADQALEYARKSQEAADLATQNAEIAQNKATSAQQKADEARELANSADRKLAEARTALAEAKQNLQDIINGGGTEDEIAAAEEKVRQAEIVVEQALADATEAEQMAKKAQDAADTAKADAVEAQNVAKDATDKAINAKAVSDKAMQAAKEAQEKVAALTKRITTAETAINQNSEAIELSAKKTEEIGNKLDNLQIGGRNILLDSRDGIICANSDFVDTTTPGEIITTKATGEGNAHSIITDKYSIPVVDLVKKVGTSYAFSIDVKITGSFTGLYFGVDFRTKDGTGNCFENWIRPESITADQWFRFSQVDAIKEDQNGITDSLFCFHWIDSTSGSTIEYKNLKLEEGNKATDWSPAPEDVLDGLDEVKDDLKNNYYNKTETDSAIKVSADNINLKVNEVSETTQSTAKDLTNYIESNRKEIENLQRQIDGSITTWFYEYTPTESNKPAIDWNTNDLKNNHLGDLFYDTSTGYCYRWQIQSSQYSWNRITDVDITKALSDAAAAQDTADSKRRVFVNTPKPPYDVGDLWVQGVSGDLMRCSIAKTESQTYSSSDWVKASKYTDDTVANDVKNDLTTNYYNKTETKAQIDLSADAITQSVSKTYTTKDEFNNLNIGGRNWLKDSGQEVVSSEHKIHTYTPSSPLVSGDEYTLSICITPASGVNRIEAYLSNGTASIANIDCKGVVKQILHKTFVAKYESGKDPSANQSNADVSIYRFPNDSSVTGSSTIHWIKIEKGNKATDWSPAPEDVNGAIRSDSPPDDKTKLWLDTSTNPNLLKQWDGHDWIVINDPTEEIQYLRKELLSSITETSDKIKMEVSEKYYEKGETDTKVSEMGTRLEQTKNDFNFIFEEFQQSLNDLSNSTNSEIQKISKYIRFIDGNIVLGQVGNELTLKIQHDRISFIQNNIEVAYFSNRKLYVTDGEYTNSLTLGNFAFTPRANGNLSFRKAR